VDLHILNALCPGSPIFGPLFPICNFAFINICYTEEYVVLKHTVTSSKW
jgi:hypothetical protein